MYGQDVQDMERWAGEAKGRRKHDVTYLFANSVEY